MSAALHGVITSQSECFRSTCDYSVHEDRREEELGNGSYEPLVTQIRHMLEVRFHLQAV